MFAGKSESLRQIVETSVPGTCGAFKPSTDTRDAPEEFVTHDGHHVPCACVQTAGDILTLSRDAGLKRVCIEEAQFFGPAVIQVCRELSDGGVDVFVSCLDMDSNRLPFGCIGDLMAVADRVVKLRSRCAVCGGPATYSRRKVAVASQTFIGGEESYEPRCGTCWGGEP
ncbi:MAG: hypothetical protein MJ058_04235 [Akkermansia sp.]|nr:hypothetical protein [Akkermansia sp.]